MQEGKKSQIRLVIMFYSNYFPREGKYLPGWQEPVEEEIIRLCLYHTIFINLYISQTKNMFQCQKWPPEVLYRKSCS